MNDDMATELGEIRALLEALLRLEVYDVLKSEFDENPKIRLLFELTGRATRLDLKKRTRLGTNTIGEAWANWHTRGLIRKRGKQYEKLWRE